MSGLYARNDALLEELFTSGKLNATLDESGKPVIWYNGEPRTQIADVRGYVRISIGNWRQGRKKDLQVHRIVYRVFKGNLDPEKVINHLDGNPLNNAPSNLELVTQGQNNLHRFRVLGRPGVKSNTKTSQAEAEQIRADQQAGMTNRQLRAKYGLAKSTISYIVNSRTWKSS